ncbi:MAG TPA: ComF family protein [Syntrophobacteraceae bacterium]|nr:ComF family protein [Syntrophobacteraceae bacterium]
MPPSSLEAEAGERVPVPGRLQPVDAERVLMRTRVGEVARRIGQALGELFCPASCAGCGRTWLESRDGFWCGSCREGLPWIRSPKCPLCGRPFPKSPSSSDHLCGNCLRGEFHFQCARSATYHSGVVRDRIHQFKFGGRLHWGPPLSELLVETARREGLTEADCIVPVPLHVRRLRQRGFNQAALLGRFLGARLHRPVRYDLLYRFQWTDPQTRLHREQRHANVKNAFRVGNPQHVKGLHVLLVDDVFTTGSTLNECARSLRRAGAGEVTALTVARALPDWKEDWKEKSGDA